MLAINQLIKIIIGVVVISVVVMGLYFFGSYVADFFGNMIGGEEEKEEGVVVKENTVDDKEEKLIQEISATFCEDKCYDGVGCPFWECTAISNKISQYGKKCDFSWGFVSGNDCITVNK